MKIEEFIKEATNQKITPLQITEFKSKFTEVKVLNEKLEKHISSTETFYEINAKINEKYVKVNTNYLDNKILELLIFKSENIESNYEDVFIKDPVIIKEEQENTIIDIQKDISKIIKLSELKKNHPNLDSIESIYENNRIQKRIINTYGVDITTNKDTYTFYIETTIKNKEQISNVEDIIYTTSNKNINFSKIAKNCIEQAEKSLNKEKLTTGRYDIVLSSDFMSKILREIVSLLSKEQIRKKISCLENKLDEKIFSSKVTIIEDATNKNYPGYTKFDNEGTATYKKEIIKEGILKTYLYNNKEGIIDNCKSTANGYGKISVSNMYIEPGNKALEEIINSVEDGLYISKYLETGGVVLNPTNGDISVQVFGFTIKNGKIVKGFEPCILTTTIFELLNNIKEIGNNMEFKTQTTASPTILVEKVSISSN